MTKPTYENTPEALATLITPEKFAKFYRELKTGSIISNSHKSFSSLTNDQQDKLEELASFFIRSPEATPTIKGFVAVDLPDQDAVAYVKKGLLGETCIDTLIDFFCDYS